MCTVGFNFCRHFGLTSARANFFLLFDYWLAWRKKWTKVLWLTLFHFDVTLFFYFCSLLGTLRIMNTFFRILRVHRASHSNSNYVQWTITLLFLMVIFTLSIFVETNQLFEKNSSFLNVCSFSILNFDDHSPLAKSFFIHIMIYCHFRSETFDLFITKCEAVNLLRLCGTSQNLLINNWKFNSDEKS